MCPAIDNPASCEIRSVIRFVHTKDKSAAEIHHEVCAVYGQNLMYERTVRMAQNVQRQDGGEKFTIKSEVLGLSSVFSDNIV
jgi:hypothetical protein